MGSWVIVAALFLPALATHSAPMQPGYRRGQGSVVDRPLLMFDPTQSVGRPKP